MLFRGFEHKFTGFEHKFRGLEHKFRGLEQKISQRRKSFYPKRGKKKDWGEKKTDRQEVI